MTRTDFGLGEGMVRDKSIWDTGVGFTRPGRGIVVMGVFLIRSRLLCLYHNDKNSPYDK